jgi:hypothetical protein
MAKERYKRTYSETKATSCYQLFTGSDGCQKDDNLGHPTGKL